MMSSANMDYYLSRLPVFKELPPEARADLDRVFLSHSYKRGESVFAEGAQADAVYLLRSGLIKAVKHSPHDDPIIMQIIAPGHVFGMMAVMDRKAYPVSAVCVNDSEAYRIKSGDFFDLLKRYPGFSKVVFEEIGVHLRHGQAMRAAQKEPADKRIAFILWVLHQTVGPDLNIRREEIAEMAGTTVETAIRALIRFREKKLVSSRWKRITILKPEALRDYA